jgi:uncharacterized protein (DUF1501 family)
MKQNRREFIKKSGCALGMAALATQIEHFGLMSVLAQKTDDSQLNAPPSDYRALVCVFLEGGNDGNNTIIPLHNDANLSSYQAYYNVRNSSGLAIPQASLLPITIPRVGNLTYGLNNNLGPIVRGVNNGIHELWAQGKMAIVGNVGTLVKPMTKAQFQNNSVKRPLQLFSHPDQVSQYQSGRADVKLSTGWGGRIADRRTTQDNPNGLAPMITSVSGVQLFTSGQTTFPLAIANAQTPLNQVLNPHGFDDSPIAQARLAALNRFNTQDLDANYIAAASRISQQALQVNSTISTYHEVSATFPATNFGNQLKQVARMIKKRTDLSVNRQIFYVSLSGFDTHIGQITAQSALLAQFSQAARSFYDEMVVQGVSDKVTLFTMSDFSRTLDPAGSGVNVGSDHAWANHLFVLGGAVNGGNFYGMNTPNGTPYPALTIGGPDDVSSGTGARGRWIPTTSVEQYAATLARWYGLPETDMPLVFPNYANFTDTNLGFMQA